MSKENIFISTEQPIHKVKHGQTKYKFGGEEYFYLDANDESNVLQRSFQTILKKEARTFRVKLCLYKLVDECKEPFLQFLLMKRDEKMTFPEFELNTGDLEKETNVDNAFTERCASEFIKIVSSGISRTVAIHCFRGFLEEDDEKNTLYVWFDCTHLRVDIHQSMFWGILDEIVNEKHIFQTPIDKDIYGMIQNNEFVAYIKDKNGERINMPCCLYLCRVNEKGEYDNVHYASDEHNMQHKSPVEGKITHEKFGHFYYFTTDPIHKDASPHKLKRFSVFIDNALYILNINKDIKDIDFVTEDEDDFDETHKSFKDYTCIYFFEDGLQLWCVKSLSRFVEL